MHEKNNEETREMFLVFLAENKALRKYLKRIGAKNIEELKAEDQMTPYLYISNAFIWSKTIDGMKYWCRLNQKWIELLDTK